MNVASLTHSLYEFAVELRQLAYTMPGGHENPLVHLSERMVRCAREQAADLGLNADSTDGTRSGSGVTDAGNETTAIGP